VLALMHRRGLVEQLGERFNSCGVESGVVMNGVEPDFEQHTQIGTIQTFSRRINYEEYDWATQKPFKPWEHPADVILLDEAHRSLSKTFQDTLKSYENKIVLGFTATPTLSTGVGMGNYYEALIQPVGVRELINCGALVPGVYYGLPAPDLTGIRVIAGDYEKKTLSERVDDKKLIGDIVLNWSKIATGKRTLVFAVNVKHSQAIVHEFERSGIPAEHLDAHSTDEKRTETINRFKTGETQVVSNVGLFTEGTDLPEIECVCLARPTKSIGAYLQMIGRGARPNPGKRDFTVLDHGKNVNEHGFYEDPITWTLEGKKISYYKPESKFPKIRAQMECRICCAIFTGSKCPVCLTEVENYGKKIKTLEYELKQLGEVKKEKSKKKTLLNYPAAVLVGMLKSEAARLGKTDKWIRANYRELTDKWPKSLDVRSVPATQEMKGWLQYKRIQWIKRKQEEKK